MGRERDESHRGGEHRTSEFCVLINIRHHRYVEEKGQKERSDIMHALSKIIYPDHPKKKKKNAKTRLHMGISPL